MSTYCLMDNHVHFVLRTPEPDLSDGLQRVFGRYARAFNDRYELDGHLFQGRFGSVLINLEAHHLEVYRYVAMNPVRAGLSLSPDLFTWSAHAALLGQASAPLLLDKSLAPFGGDRERYAAFVADAGSDFLTDLLGDHSRLRLAAAADAGFTQREIAQALGIAQSTVARRLQRIKGV